MMMGHNNLANYYKTNFALTQYHGWDLEYMDNQIPWERYIYIDLLHEYLKEEEKKAQLREQERKAEMANIQRKINAKNR